MIDKPIPFRTYGELAKFVLESFVRLGIAVQPGSRLDQMVKAIFDADGNQRLKIKKSDPNFQTAIEAGRDLQQLAFVFDCLPDEVLTQFKPELKKIRRDQPLPQFHNGDSWGRDNQFHLYAAAIAHNAGCTVRSAEPDVICCLPGGDEFGIAAKRVKKTEALEDRIRKGSDQIVRSKIPGLIVVETSLALNPTNDRIYHQLSEDDFLRAYHGYFDEFITRNNRLLQKLVDPWWVCGIVFHDQQVRVVGSAWETAGMTIGLAFPARCVADPERLSRCYETGLPNRVVSPIVSVQPRLLLPASLSVR